MSTYKDSSTFDDDQPVFPARPQKRRSRVIMDEVLKQQEQDDNIEETPAAIMAPARPNPEPEHEM